MLGCEWWLRGLLPQARQAPVPVLYYLSGLTCTDENFVAKAGAQQYAAAHDCDRRRLPVPLGEAR